MTRMMVPKKDRWYTARILSSKIVKGVLEHTVLYNSGTNPGSGYI